MANTEIINLINANKENFINFSEEASQINEDCIIDSIRMLKIIKSDNILKVPSSSIYDIYLYNENDTKWILKKFKNRIFLYKY